MTKPRIKSLSLSNYLGCGSKNVVVDFGVCRHLALVGRNNSGKTNIASALNLLKRSLQTTFVTGSGNSGGNTEVRLGWSDAGQATADIFHKGAETCELEVALEVGRGTFHLNALLDKLGVQEQGNIQISFAVEFNPNHKRLKSLKIGSMLVFVKDGVSALFNHNGGDTYLAKLPQLYVELLSLPHNLMLNSLYYPSTRSIGVGGNVAQEDDLTSGSAIPGWVQQASNANAKELQSIQRHRVLNEFCAEFAKFIGAKTIRLVVSSLCEALDYVEYPRGETDFKHLRAVNCT